MKSFDLDFRIPDRAEPEPDTLVGCRLAFPGADGGRFTELHFRLPEDSSLEPGDRVRVRIGFPDTFDKMKGQDMKASFNGARRNLATAFSRLVRNLIPTTRSQRTLDRLDELRSAIGALLAMYDPNVDGDADDLSETIRLPEIPETAFPDVGDDMYTQTAGVRPGLGEPLYLDPESGTISPVGFGDSRALAPQIRWRRLRGFVAAKIDEIDRAAVRDSKTPPLWYRDMYEIRRRLSRDVDFAAAHEAYDLGAPERAILVAALEAFAKIADAIEDGPGTLELADVAASIERQGKPYTLERGEA